MTNREKFLKKLSGMSNDDLAEKICYSSICDDCPVGGGFCRGYVRLAEWLEKEADSDDNSRDFDF